MGEEDRRLFLSNGRSEADPRGFGVGARLQRSKIVAAANKRHAGRDRLNGSGGGDSDGMMGSGGESDSSEEIHYGPGFVSRLKSRYMSVALRGSARGSLGTLRRTASLEDFLELERTKDANNRDPGVVSPTHKSQYLRDRSYGGTAITGGAATCNKGQSKRESMKRAQSVEVLSILSDSPKKGRDSILTDAFFNTEKRPPSVSPPPLPPREKLELNNINLVLNTTSSLVNQCVHIAEKASPVVIPSQQPIPSSQTKHSSYSRSKYAPSGTKPILKHVQKPLQKTLQKPPSPVNTGIKDKELPAPDIVKETRKLFESESTRSSGRKLKSSTATGLTKSKSTSSLYTRSSSIDKSAMSRKKSEEDLHRALISSSSSKSTTSPPGRKPSGKPYRSSSPKQPIRDASLRDRRACNPSPGRSPNKEQTPPKLAAKNSSLRVTRPVIPAKPSHLSPILNKTNTYRSVQKDKLGQNKSVIVKPAAKVEKENAQAKPDRTEKKNEMENVRLSLTPISKATPLSAGVSALPNSPPRAYLSSPDEAVTPVSKPQGQNGARHVGQTVEAKLAVVDLENSQPSPLPIGSVNQDNVGASEEGIKRISKDSMSNIRKDASVVSFNFPASSSASKSHLPGASNKRDCKPSALVVARPTDEARSGGLVNTSSLTGGRLNGVSHNAARIESRVSGGGTSRTATASLNCKQAAEKPVTPSKFTATSQSTRVAKQPASAGRQANAGNPEPAHARPSTTRLISPDQSNNNTATGVKSDASSDRLSTGAINQEQATSGDKTQSVISCTQPLTTAPVEKLPPPSIPPRNGSKLQHTASPPKQPREKYFDSNIDAEPSPPPPGGVRRDAGTGHEPRTNGSDVPDKSAGYRDSWKARQDKQNTVVFNFINTKKDVSHIENDGLDLSQRNSSNKGVVYLGRNGESCDGPSDEESETDFLSNFVFVGANVVNGKSSIRSKNTPKKLSISWKDETEVFEYPFCETSWDETSSSALNSTTSEGCGSGVDGVSSGPTTLKSNTIVGATGGLGSYTPSKIQLSEAPFQLGVSRSQPPTPTVAVASTGQVSPARIAGTSPSPPCDVPCLRPADQGISWGSSASSDMLF